MSEKNLSSDELILAIDSGTQSIRAGLVDLRGQILDLVKTPIEPYFSKHPGWAEQDPEYYWTVLCQTTRQLLENNVSLKDRLKAVTVTTQRMTFINVDEHGKSLRPAIVWLDQRKADPTRILPWFAGPLLRLANLKEFVEYAVGLCRSNWIQQNQPEIWERTHKWLYLSGFYNHRLTGRFVDTVGAVVGPIPFDSKKQCWADRRDPKWLLFPVEHEKLPDLLKPGETLGEITHGASQKTGIPRGLPLIAASNDKACEIIGAGCLDPSIACISFGTTATIDTQNDKYIELLRMMPPYPSAIPDQYYSEISVVRGLWMVTWFKEEFGLQERLESTDARVQPEVLFERLIRDVPPGSMGLMLQPYWLPGPEVSSSAKGSVIGFGDVHTRAHLYRAIIEGLIYALKEGGILIMKKNKKAFDKIRVSGGGSQSDSIVQITADVFGLPVERPHTHETSILGAAMDAAVGLGLFPDFKTAGDDMTGVAQVFEPIPENVKLYEDLYHRVYLRMYKQLLPLFKEIQDITGYPE